MQARKKLFSFAFYVNFVRVFTYSPNRKSDMRVFTYSPIERSGKSVGAIGNKSDVAHRHQAWLIVVFVGFSRHLSLRTEGKAVRKIGRVLLNLDTILCPADTS
jgi:hypothetical protein